MTVGNGGTGHGVACQGCALMDSEQRWRERGTHTCTNSIRLGN